MRPVKSQRSEKEDSVLKKTEKVRKNYRHTAEPAKNDARMALYNFVKEKIGF